ncbi:MAG: hypothetical protein IAI49_10950, partial [Candidatus Eremiobacteraeota bacterium]|nr:hypothetical protein [Candidatus Eremiobacteraeota bacterium]
MRPVYRLRALGVLLSLVLWLVFSLATPAFAASTLSAIRVDATPSGGALVSVNFAGPPPTFHVVGAGTPETSILLDNTTLGPQAPPSVAGAGPVTSVSVATTGTSSSLALHLTTGARVSVRSGSNFLFIDVASAAPNPLAALLPPQTSVTPAQGTVTEVVELKYADISEIAGVLSPNSTIASNDTFSPTQTNIGTSSLSGSFGGVSGGGFSAPTTPQSFGGGGGVFGQSTGLAQRV